MAFNRRKVSLEQKKELRLQVIASRLGCEGFVFSDQCQAAVDSWPDPTNKPNVAELSAYVRALGKVKKNDFSGHDSEVGPYNRLVDEEYQRLMLAQKAEGIFGERDSVILKNTAAFQRIQAQFDYLSPRELYLNMNNIAKYARKDANGNDIVRVPRCYARNGIIEGLVETNGSNGSVASNLHIPPRVLSRMAPHLNGKRIDQTYITQWFGDKGLMFKVGHSLDPWDNLKKMQRCCGRYGVVLSWIPRNVEHRLHRALEKDVVGSRWHIMLEWFKDTNMTRRIIRMFGFDLPYLRGRSLEWEHPYWKEEHKFNPSDPDLYS